jgi:hypothetical protein
MPYSSQQDMKNVREFPFYLTVFLNFTDVWLITEISDLIEMNHLEFLAVSYLFFCCYKYYVETRLKVTVIKPQVKLSTIYTR